MFEFTTEPSKEDDLKLEREPLFSLDGTEYGIPKQFPMAWFLRYAVVAQTESAAAAVDYIVNKALGPDALLALSEAPDRYSEDIRKIFGIIQARVEGRSADGKIPGPAPKATAPKKAPVKRSPRKTPARKTASRPRSTA